MVNNDINLNTGISPDNKSKVGNVIPENLIDNKVETTVVKSLSKMIDDKLLAIKDLASLEIMMTVSARLRERMKSIREMSTAKHLKIKGHFRTETPKMHITNLQGHKLSSDEAEITFKVYDTDKEGNKKVTQHSTEIVKENGDKLNRVISAEYKIAFEVTETIRRNKAITREIIKIGEVE